MLNGICIFYKQLYPLAMQAAKLPLVSTKSKTGLRNPDSNKTTTKYYIHSF